MRPLNANFQQGGLLHDFRIERPVAFELHPNPAKMLVFGRFYFSFRPKKNKL